MSRLSQADVREAALLVLPHRRRRQPFGDTRLDQDKLEETFKKFQAEQELSRCRPARACSRSCVGDSGKGPAYRGSDERSGRPLPGAAPGAGPQPPESETPPAPAPGPEATTAPDATSGQPCTRPGRPTWPWTRRSGPRRPTRQSVTRATWPWPSPNRTCATRCGSATNRPPHPPGGGRVRLHGHPGAPGGRPRPPSCRCSSTPTSAGSGWGWWSSGAEKPSPPCPSPTASRWPSAI